jgi:hypothetical protein
VKRDRIVFDVFSPYTAGKMIVGAARMKELQEKTDRAVQTVTVNGAGVKRVLLRTGQKFYRSAIDMYLLDKVLARVEAALDSGAAPWGQALDQSPSAVFSRDWIDIGGQLMPRQRLDDLCAAVEAGGIRDLDALNAEFDKILAAYAEDEWAWVRWAHRQVFGAEPADLTAEQLASAADELAAARGKFLNLVLNDAAKEFSDAIRTGFGQDGEAADVATDFAAVRGELETNKFVKQMRADIAAVEDRVKRFKQAVLKSEGRS